MGTANHSTARFQSVENPDSLLEHDLGLRLGFSKRIRYPSRIIASTRY